MKHFSRPQLAEEMIDAILGKNLFGDSHNGLFLAAPRRTGKTTFLRLDLKPALEQRGVEVVYVDLWSSPERDPGLVISEAIGEALTKYASFMAKAAKTSGIHGLSIPGVMSIDIGRIGRMDGAALTDALHALILAAKKPVALIIDEAQHSLISENGRNCMFALKSARDQLNQPGVIQLVLVMSGSDRDKLLHLVHGNSAPFFGSRVGHMPELGADFITFIAQAIEETRPDLTPIDAATLLLAFESFGNRPQLFMAAVSDAVSPLAGALERFENMVMAEALKQRDLDEQEMESAFLGLTPLGRAILWRMLEREGRFRPYDAEALRFYKEKTGRSWSITMIQKTLQTLRDQDPPMVWKSAMGEYSVSDAAMHRWYLGRVKHGGWPPARD